ncbi:MAG: Sensor protein [uncultured bacterium]|nr:MAG: Sensor protein [uncultured bacterium]
MKENIIELFSKHKIKTKLLIIIVFISSIAVLTGNIILFFGEYILLKKDLSDQSYANSNLISLYCIPPLIFDDKKGAEKDILSKLSAISSIDFAQIYDKNMKPFASYTKAGFLRTDTPTLEENVPTFIKNHLHIFNKITFEKELYGYLHVCFSTKIIQVKIIRLIIILTSIFFMILILSIFIAQRFQKIISKPIIELTQIAEKITNDSDYSIRLNITAKDEIGSLQKAINIMVINLQKNITSLKEEISFKIKAQEEKEKLLKLLEVRNQELEEIINITYHDLRTPLVNIQGFSKELDYICTQVKNAINVVNFPHENQTIINNYINTEIPQTLNFIGSNAIIMGNLIHGLSDLFKLNQDNINIQELSMPKLITEVVNNMSYEINKKNVTVNILPDIPNAFGDFIKITQLLYNLISNAIKYKHPNRPCIITISGVTEDNFSTYCVEDNGIGINPKYHKKIFEIFHRLNPNSDVPGEGIGLAIAKRITNRMDGKIWLESEENKGSKFFFSLKRSID